MSWFLGMGGICLVMTIAAFVARSYGFAIFGVVVTTFIMATVYRQLRFLQTIEEKRLKASRDASN